MEDEKPRWVFRFRVAPFCFTGPRLHDLPRGCPGNELPMPWKARLPFDHGKTGACSAFVLEQGLHLGQRQTGYIQPAYRAEAAWSNITGFMAFRGCQRISQPLPELQPGNAAGEYAGEQRAGTPEQHLPLSLFGFSGFR